jgi:hypothetical protein
MKIHIGRVVAVALAATWVLLWSGSLAVALQDHSHEVVGPAGHGSFEAAFMTLVGITQPLGLLAGVVLGQGPSGRAGIVLVWCVAGLLGAIQWAGVGVIAVATWRQFRPQRTTLRLR